VRVESKERSQTEQTRLPGLCEVLSLSLQIFIIGLLCAREKGDNVFQVSKQDLE
jgi:hypothetical protein